MLNAKMTVRVAWLEVLLTVRDKMRINLLARKDNLSSSTTKYKPKFKEMLAINCN
jgi:hypothetical protein